MGHETSNSEQEHQAPGTWKSVSRNPCPSLARIVERMIGYEEWSPGPVRRIEVAQPCVTFILNLGDPLTVGGAASPPRSLGSFVAGRIDLFGTTEFTGRSRGLQLDMTPQGARMFLAMPMSELEDVVLPLEDALGGFGVELIEKLFEAKCWTSRFDILEAAIKRRMVDAPAPSPDALWAWNRIQACGGLDPISSLAAELGCSRRHLSARFRDQVGVAPKTAARVIRFRRAVELLRRDDGGSFVEIAGNCGFYDQAHMNREFRKFAGTSPGNFVAS